MAVRTKKLINRPQDIQREMLAGFAAAYPDVIRLTEDGLIVRRVEKEVGKVGLVIGNGTGHEPAMIGLIGPGWLDVNVPGEIFAAPGPDRIVRGIQVADRGAGVLLLVSHHEGDRINAEIAMDLCAAQGIAPVEMVLLYDDISSAPKGSEADRRGTSGLFFVWKMLGAYAEMGASLSECRRMAEKIRDRTRTLAVALTPGSSPINREVMFELPDDEMEIGMGVHGEMGQGRLPFTSADATVAVMLPQILADLPFRSGDEVLVMLNDSGSMTQMELFIAYRHIALLLSGAGIQVYKCWVGRYATTQEMAGMAISLCKVDEQLKSLWDAPAIGANVRWVQP
ncbi:MAG: dihydroxyacetone kinase subunit DhaK [Anaerolineaceae bacterium]|nr:dihydroxyacetone kinase subunit DhaK [Anaerolineaceae bacterium]